ncbi:MAG: anaerobic ribonucleoside-triphosphate reductase activating protein [Lachnospiraceae bacterium]|nr:anaerobic ribonucleoside-triphosphate reductase activating protein [Lachnospiraceae bacterium]
MNIHGLNKLTLLDYPGKLSALVFTGACNFRCPFCQNASLVLRPDSQPLIMEEEFFRFLESRKGVLEGVCITGGEPTLQKDLPDFAGRIKELGFLVKLDTNGYKPDVLKTMVNEGLVDYVAMDIKNSKDRYAETAGLSFFDITKIEESVEFLKTGNVDYEFRTTVTKTFHDLQSVLEMSEWIKGAKRYYLQSFKDSGDLIDKKTQGYSEAEMKELFNQVKTIVHSAELRGI